MMKPFELLARLAAAAQPSGFEGPQAAILAELARPFADEVRTDLVGNVICHKKGPGKRVMIPAHMDVLGLLVTDADDRGYLRFEPLGGHAPFQLVGTTVRLESGVRGSIWPDSEAGLGEKALDQADLHDLFIDIGAESREEALKLAPLGSVCAFDAPTVRLAGDRIMTPYADDLSGCAAVLLAMEKIQNPANDLWFVFSVQEEVGCRGAVSAAWQIDPQLGIACDVCGTGDTPGELEHQRMQVRLGAGPTVKRKDGGMECDPQAVNHLLEAARRAGVETQTEVLLGGTTDARSMQLSRQGVPVTCVSIPCRNIHSPAEIVSEGDIEQAAALLAAAAELAF